MTASLGIAEGKALDEVERRLVHQGYSVLRQPKPDARPDFLGRFQPDAIAVGKLPQMVIEVIAGRGSPHAATAKIRQLRQLIDGHPDWALEVIYAAPGSPSLGVSDLSAVRKRFKDVRDLAFIDRTAAMVMAWSVLEATTRALLPDQTERALSPASTTELLTSLGYVSQAEAVTLRDAGRLRNLIAHGDLVQQVASTELEAVFAIIARLISALEGQSGKFE